MVEKERKSSRKGEKLAQGGEEKEKLA